MITGKQWKVLWIDNDVGHLMPFVEALKENGYELTICASVLEAEEALRRKVFDLVILDIMIPIVSEEEERLYPSSATANGLETGLLFLKRLREELNLRDQRVVILSVRLDKGIKEKVEESGVREGDFWLKMEVRTEERFLDRVKATLERRGADA